MNKILLISKTQDSIELLANLLKSEGYTQIFTAFTSTQAKVLAKGQRFDLIIINAPIAESREIDLAVYLADTTRAGVMLLLKEGELCRFGTGLTEKGVLTLQKPLNKQLFCTAIAIWQAAKKRLIGLEKENIELKTKVEDIKLIHRAKCVLIECLNMTEPQAHRYLEKQAMDMQASKRQIAEQVLNTYEN